MYMCMYMNMQVIAAEWYVPPNSSELTSRGKYPHALDGFLQVCACACTCNMHACACAHAYAHPHAPDGCLQTFTVED